MGMTAFGSKVSFLDNDHTTVNITIGCGKILSMELKFYNILPEGFAVGYCKLKQETGLSRQGGQA
jgi:hypothetical protein